MVEAGLFSELGSYMRNLFLKIVDKENIKTPIKLRSVKPKDFKLDKEKLIGMTIVGIIENYANRDSYPIKIDKHYFLGYIKNNNKEDLPVSLIRNIYSTEDPMFLKFVDNLNIIEKRLYTIHPDVHELYGRKINSVLGSLKDFNMQKYTGEKLEVLAGIFIPAVLLNTFMTSYQNKKTYKGVLKSFDFLKIKKYVLEKSEIPFENVFIGNDFTQKLEKFATIVFKKLRE
jgi:hypothetical protein